MTEWLRALSGVNVPCALVSQLDKNSVRHALERMGLHDYFTLMVRCMHACPSVYLVQCMPYTRKMGPDIRLYAIKVHAGVFTLLDSHTA